MFTSTPSKKNQQQQEEGKEKGQWRIGVSFKAENLIPGVVIGFIIGMILDLTNPPKKTITNTPPTKHGHPLLDKLENLNFFSSSSTHSDDEEFKMVLVVRQDLKMGTGKIASQCAHAAMAMYSELLQSQRSLLSQWKRCGQPKVVVTCKNQKEMNKLQEEAESIGLPTFVVADAGRTQVASGSKTVLAIGPGRKASVDSVTRKQRLL